MEKPLKFLWLDHPYVRAFRNNMERKKLMLDGCRQCLSRYPFREFYVKDGSFVPEVIVMVGDELDFRGDGKRALVFGFAANADSNGNRWTIANRPLFGFHILDKPPSSLPNAIMLEIDGIAFAPSEMGNDQYVDVLVNNKKIARWPLLHLKLEKYRATFSSALLRDGEAMFALRFTERRSPSELKIGPDLRKLGMSVSRIAISEAA